MGEVFIYSAIRIPAVEMTPEEQEQERLEFLQLCAKYGVYPNENGGVNNGGGK